MRRILIPVILSALLSGTHALAQVQRPSATTGPERGALVLVGGGANRPVFINRFVELAGGRAAMIVLIPTSLEDDRLTQEGIEHLKGRLQEILAVDHVTVLHTRDPKQADSPEFVKPLGQATGVWILGGNEEYLMKAYVGTRVQREIKALLARGGVVGGTSAGAIIQGSLSIQGKIVDSPEKPGGKSVRVESTDTCWGLLTNSVITPHWSQRKIEDLLAMAMATQPGVLGIAIDENTAAIVQGNRLEVLGDGHVGIYDGKDHNGKSYVVLGPGERFDLARRMALPLHVIRQN
jgi:cyanophycinase